MILIIQAAMREGRKRTEANDFCVSSYGKPTLRKAMLINFLRSTCRHNVPIGKINVDFSKAAIDRI
jgi:hypothetical protein